MDWNPDDLNAWSDPDNTDDILSGRGRVTRRVARACWRRVRQLRNELRDRWVLPVHPDWGHITDWVLATLIARENVLLLGAPGVAKSEIATRTFELIGLQKPEGNVRPMPENEDPYAWWEKRRDEERKKSKFFHYQLSRFTQIEELFGPVEITLLRRGVLVRVNYAMITGPGVRAAFIDEIFKASGALLNSLLMLFNERTYFNWGGMIPGDLSCVIAASNEMPGAFSGMGAAAGSSEDFHTLYAMLDRLAIRLDVPPASGSDALEHGGTGLDALRSSLGKASGMAIDRESRKFGTGSGFATSPLACVNDLLALGRGMLSDRAGSESDESLFEEKSADLFHKSFINVGASLQQSGTDLDKGNITWTISPRKLKALYKVARAHALITDDGFGDDKSGTLVKLTPKALRVYRHIWDTPGQRDALDRATEESCNSNWR